MTRAVILSAVRTPIGRYGGGFAGVRPDDRAAPGLDEERVNVNGVAITSSAAASPLGLASLCVGVG